jgi:hypothetical protein
MVISSLPVQQREFRWCTLAVGCEPAWSTGTGRSWTLCRLISSIVRGVSWDRSTGQSGYNRTQRYRPAIHTLTILFIERIIVTVTCSRCMRLVLNCREGPVLFPNSPVIIKTPHGWQVLPLFHGRYIWCSTVGPHAFRRSSHIRLVVMTQLLQTPSYRARE